MRSGLGLPERRLKMLMKIRSARLCFLGNLIYFSCTTVSPTPVFHVLGHRKLRVLALGLVWPRSDSLSPARAGEDTGSVGRAQSGAFGSAAPWCGSGWGHGLETPRTGTSSRPDTPGVSLIPQNRTTNCPAHPTGQLWQKLLFLSKQPEEGPVPRRGLRGAQEIYR